MNLDRALASRERICPAAYHAQSRCSRVGAPAPVQRNRLRSINKIARVCIVKCCAAVVSFLVPVFVVGLSFHETLTKFSSHFLPSHPHAHTMTDVCPPDSALHTPRMSAEQMWSSGPAASCTAPWTPSTIASSARVETNKCESAAPSLGPLQAPPPPRVRTTSTTGDFKMDGLAASLPSPVQIVPEADVEEEVLPPTTCLASEGTLNISNDRTRLRAPASSGEQSFRPRPGAARLPRRPAHEQDV